MIQGLGRTVSELRNRRHLRNENEPLLRQRESPDRSTYDKIVLSENQQTHPALLEHLNRSLVAYIAVRPEKGMTDYEPSLRKGVQAISAAKIVSPCTDGSKPYAELSLGGRPVCLAVQLNRNSGAVDLHFYDNPSVKSDQPYRPIDGILLDDDVYTIIHEIFMKSYAENWAVNKTHPKFLIALKVLAKGLRDAANADPEIPKMMTMLN